MTTVTSRRATPDPKILKRRRELIEERLDIERRLEPDYDRITVIEAELKQMATAEGASFAENVAGKGDVSVAPSHDAEFKGDVPQVQTEAWQALKPSERKAHEKTGLIKVVPQWGKRFSGRVTVKALRISAAKA
jgi:hypothetical protein